MPSTCRHALSPLRVILAFAPPRRRDPQQHAPRPAYVPAWYLRERCGELKRAAATSRVCITISRVSLIVLPARIRRVGQRLPYHQNAQTRRTRDYRLNCRTNSSLRENCRCWSRAKSLSSRGNSQSRKVENVRYVRYLIRGDGSWIRTMNLGRRIFLKLPMNSAS
jgi:hypothetical protein